MTERPTDDQLKQWLYDAECDWDDDDYESPMPSNDFPHYYEDVYRPTLAVLFREILEARTTLARVKALGESWLPHNSSNGQDATYGDRLIEALHGGPAARYREQAIKNIYVEPILQQLIDKQAEKSKRG